MNDQLNHAKRVEIFFYDSFFQNEVIYRMKGNDTVFSVLFPSEEKLVIQTIADVFKLPFLGKKSNQLYRFLIFATNIPTITGIEILDTNKIKVYLKRTVLSQSDQIIQRIQNLLNENWEAAVQQCIHPQPAAQPSLF